MTGISIHIGVNRVSAQHYGSEQPLKGAVADSDAMKAIAEANGFATRQFVNEDATSLTVLDAIEQAAAQLDSGDILFISYAGHGSQMFDHLGDEPDSLDETWCLYDRMVLDDELYRAYGRFARGTRVLIVSDSCHSGTVARVAKFDPRSEYPDPNQAAELPYPVEDELTFRALPEEAARAAFLRNQGQYGDVRGSLAQAPPRDLQCSLQLLAACQDHQLAADGAANGYFTQHLLHRWQEGRFSGSYTELFQAIERAMPRRQKPNRMLLGEATAEFADDRPFSIAT